MKFKLFIASLALFLVATAANAQSVDSNSQSTAGSNSGSVSQVSLTQNTSGNIQYGGHFSQTQNAQVPISVVGYGSFSQSSCVTAVGAGATTRMFSFVYNGPKADVNCQHVVSGDAFGRAAQLAMQMHAPTMAMSSLSMVFYKYCTSDEDTKRGCISMGLVTATGKVTRIHGEDVAEVLPSKVLPPGAQAMASAMLGVQPPAPAPVPVQQQSQPNPLSPQTNFQAPTPDPSQAVAGTWQSQG